MKYFFLHLSYWSFIFLNPMDFKHNQQLCLFLFLSSEMLNAILSVFVFSGLSRVFSLLHEAYCWLVKADGRHRGPFPPHACTHIMAISQLVWG